MRHSLLSPHARRSIFTGRRALLAGAVAAALGLAGCAATRSTERAESYDSREWMQSSANRIANLALRDNLQSIRRVQLSLYRRNPREWRKSASSADDAIQRTWDAITQATPLPALGGKDGKSGIEAVRLAFEPGYAGDRIAALVYGWATMLKEANGNTWEQTLIDGVNAENSYRAARNIEISLWLIGSKTGADGQPLLLATEISERGRNLVVDRELSKIVARLDLLAAQADEKYRRAALDFAQGWIMGSLGPFLALAKP